MTKAIYNIKKTFKGMAELHQKEVDNHQNLIDTFMKRSKVTEDHQERVICLLEAHRNREHQNGHKTMIIFYKYLEKSL